MSNIPLDFLKKMKEMNDEMTETQLTVRAKFQELLDQMVGQSFGSLEANVEVAGMIRDLLFRLEVRLECPREGCSQPSLIRCRPAGRTLHGAFGFEHRMGDRVMVHAGPVRLPRMKLVPAPLDRRRKASRNK